MADAPNLPGFIRADELRLMAQLLEEAAGHLHAFMDTDLAEQRQVRHFLPDELEGSAIMLREHADALGVLGTHESKGDKRG